MHPCHPQFNHCHLGRPLLKFVFALFISIHRQSKCIHKNFPSPVHQVYPSHHFHDLRSLNESKAKNGVAVFVRS